VFGEDADEVSATRRREVNLFGPVVLLYTGGNQVAHRVVKRDAGIHVVLELAGVGSEFIAVEAVHVDGKVVAVVRVQAVPVVVNPRRGGGGRDKGRPNIGAAVGRRVLVRRPEGHSVRWIDNRTAVVAGAEGNHQRAIAGSSDSRGGSGARR